jgi:hypothetical protein
VPPGVRSATFTVDGAAGGGGSSPGGAGGLGGQVVAMLGSLSPGAVVGIRVGGQGMSGLAGEGGSNGGGNGAYGDGGGGFSEVIHGSTVELLAGGGGGGGFSGAGGGSSSGGGDGGSGGQGGTSGGAGASTVADGATLDGGGGGYAGGDASHPGAGGAGGTVSGTSTCGVANGSAGLSGGSFQGGGGYGGGGGGGGYVGGGQGGGGAADGCGDDAGWGGGGGGSSFAAAGVSATFSTGVRSADGQVVIAYPDPIAAATHSYTATEDQTLVVPAASGVLSGASGPAGDQLSASLVSGPARGELTLNGDGSFTYTPASGYMGGDAFTYEATDPAGDYATATVTLTVAAPPTAVTSKPPPTASIAVPARGASYAQGQVVDSSFACNDGAAGPGIASCVDQSGRGSGAAIDTATPGQHTFTVTAASKDGLTGSASVTYTVTAPMPRLSRLRVSPRSFQAATKGKVIIARVEYGARIRSPPKPPSSCTASCAGANGDENSSRRPQVRTAARARAAPASCSSAPSST